MFPRTLIVVAALAVVAIAAGALQSTPRADAGEPTPRSIVEDFFATVEGGDAEAAGAMLTEDVKLTETGGVDASFAIFGRRAFVAVVRDFVIEVEPDFTISNISTQGNTVTGLLQQSDTTTEAAGVDRFREQFTITVTDANLISSIAFVFDANDAQTQEYLEFLAAEQEGDEGGEDEPGEFTVVDLAAQPGGNQPGISFVFPFEDGVAGIGIEVEPGAAGVAQPAHFHTGTCAAPGPIVQALADVIDGESFSVVSKDYDELVGQDLIINVHKSGTELGVYVSCGAVAGEAATPVATPPAATATPPTGVVAPDTGTGGAAGSGTRSLWAYAVLTAGAMAAAAGAGLRSRGAR